MSGSGVQERKVPAFVRSRTEGKEYRHLFYSEVCGHRFFVLDDVFYQFNAAGELVGYGSPASAWGSVLVPVKE